MNHRVLNSGSEINTFGGASVERMNLVEIEIISSYLEEIWAEELQGMNVLKRDQ